MKVLFSVVGRTDPANLYNLHREGPLVQLFREYKPAKTYLFLTKEMIRNSKKDDRYRQALELVSHDLGFESEIYLIEADGDEVPFHYGSYKQQLKAILRKIAEENPGKEIIVNGTSSTPQILASLYLLCATLPYPLRFVQVSDPNYSKRTDIAEYQEFDAKEWYYHKNQDRNKPIRTEVASMENIIKEMLNQSLRSFLNNYNYKAAYALLKANDEYYDSNTRALFEAAHLRTSLKFTEAIKVLRKHGMALSDLDQKGDQIRNKPKEIIKLYEYILYLTKLYNQNRFGDFARAIAPALEEFAVIKFQKEFFFDIRDYEKRNGTLNLKLLTKELNELYYDADFFIREIFYGNKPIYLSNRNILKILNKFTNQDKELIQLNSLRNFEKNVRNMAAHTMVAIDAKEINRYEKNISFPESLHQSFLSLTGVQNPDIFKAYDEMNRNLLEKIQ